MMVVSIMLGFDIETGRPSTLPRENSRDEKTGAV
jgi:hypothetical protein